MTDTTHIDAYAPAEPIQCGFCGETITRDNVDAHAVTRTGSACGFVWPDVDARSVPTAEQRATLRALAAEDPVSARIGVDGIVSAIVDRENGAESAYRIGRDGAVTDDTYWRAEFRIALQTLQDATGAFERAWTHVPADILGDTYALPESFNYYASTIGGWSVDDRI